MAVIKKDSDDNSLFTDLLKKGTKKKFYTSVKPMLATLVDKPFDLEGWSYEVKWDGYRAVAFINKDVVELKSRNDKSFNEKFYPVYDAIKKWKVNAIVDGEIVVVNKEGISDFGALQNWRSEADGMLLFYLFDILWFNGVDVTNLELTERREILMSIIPDSTIIRISADFDTSGVEFLATARKMGLEGIMAKKKSSTYQTGLRTKDWLKIKANKRQEVVIGGYTNNEGSDRLFSSLLVGVYDNEKFIYTGKVGTGWGVKLQKEMLEKFKPLIVENSHFYQKPDVNKPSRFRPAPPNARVTWLKPELVCEVSFTELTTDGIMRHPSFEGMRLDKMPKDIALEKEEPIGNVVEKSITKKVKNTKKPDDLKEMMISEIKPDALNPIVQVEEQGRLTLLNPVDKTQVRKIGKRELKFTNLNKFYWPKEKVTKRDMINYYYRLAPIILPYLIDRPMTLKRYPDGIDGFNFYQKNITGKVPAWVKKYKYYSETDVEEKNYMLVNDEETLLLMANLGSIELHPWSSTAKKPDNPTWCIIDLDPAQTSFEQVITAAQVTKQILDELGIESFCKTSGSSGMHIYIPFNNKYTYEESKEFARIIATLVHNEIPEFTSIERLTTKRHGKMYVDFLQNRPHATVAAPYSLRPKSGAPISMPLKWEEVKTGLKITDFNIHNAFDRIDEYGDLFIGVLGKGIDLKKILAKIKKMSS